MFDGCELLPNLEASLLVGRQRVGRVRRTKRGMSTSRSTCRKFDSSVAVVAAMWAGSVGAVVAVSRCCLALAPPLLIVREEAGSPERQSCSRPERKGLGSAVVVAVAVGVDAADRAAFGVVAVADAVPVVSRGGVAPSVAVGLAAAAVAGDLAVMSLQDLHW